MALETIKTIQPPRTALEVLELIKGMGAKQKLVFLLKNQPIEKIHKSKIIFTKSQSGEMLFVHFWNHHHDHKENFAFIVDDFIKDKSIHASGDNGPAINMKIFISIKELFENYILSDLEVCI